MLWELLTLDKYSNGAKRLLPTLTVERVSGGYKVLLHDHASSQYLVAETGTIEGVPRALEEALGRDLEGWRPFKAWKGRTPPKPKEGQGG